MIVAVDVDEPLCLFTGRLPSRVTPLPHTHSRSPGACALTPLPPPPCSTRSLLQVKKKALSSFDRDRLLSNVVGLTSADANWMKHFSHADVVIEAVPENLALKHKVVRGVAVVAGVGSG